MRQALRRVLEPEGYCVLEAPHGGVAMEMLRKHPADIVIMDLLMPEQEGLETILMMRSQAPQIKIIAISGGGQYGMTYRSDMAAKLGADRALMKPFDRQGLLTAIRAVQTDEAP